MTERGFVLMPLADFAADLSVGGRTVAEWLRDADVDWDRGRRRERRLVARRVSLNL